MHPPKRDGNVATTPFTSLATAPDNRDAEVGDPPIDLLDEPVGNRGGGADHRQHEPNAKPSTGGESESLSRELYRVEPYRRDESPIAPSDFDVSRLPDPFRDGENCLTIGEARQVYRRVIGSRLNAGEPCKVDDARQRYATLMQADRVLQDDWDLTTALISLRPRPLDDKSRVITPLALDRAVFAGKSGYPLRDKLRYQLKDGRDNPLNYEYVTVVAGTRHWATPHLHALVWVDDPRDEVTSETLAPVVDRLVKDCPLARPQDHFVHEGAKEGALTIRYDPPKVTESVYEGDKYAQRAVTRGAMYLGTQLPHFALEGSQPTDAAVDAAVTAWASPNKWFVTSRGVSQISTALLN